ncbi:hypothetical protein SDC9_93041 [bioreactor metagenome]|uniref:Uncharacterized protein n=1 Tax=bioreactor metagenome TaxID=1076179 RepID=A0A645A647_9ZZZZ
MVGRLQVEERLAVGRLLALIALIQRRIGLHRGDAVVRRCPGRVQLTGENGLGVARLQNETELTVAALAEFKPTCHG